MKIRGLVAIIAFAIAGNTGAYAQQPQVIDKVVAVVGKNIILQSDIEEQYLQARLQGGVKGSSSSIRCKILEELLFSKLMLNQAELDSVTVTDEQIESEMDYRIRYFVSQLGSEEKLEQYYNKKMSEIKEELRTIIKEQKLIEDVQRGIVSGVSATPSDVRESTTASPKTPSRWSALSMR